MHAVRNTYLRRQMQPMQMTVKQIINAEAAIITMAVNTAKQQRYFLHTAYCTLITALL